jgi:predicted permease
LRTFLRIAPDEVPLYVDVSPDATALLAAAGVITLAAILATAAPAAVGLRVSPAQALRGGGRGATSARNERRAGAVLVAAEVAVSTIVIVAAGLLVRSYQSMTQIDLGYRTEGILRIAVFPTELDVPRVDQLPAFADRLRNTLLEEPGVDDVSLMWPTLPPSTGVSGRIRFDGMPDDLRNHGLNVDIRAVDPNFFPLMEIPLLAGRNVHTSDAPEAPPVVIVSESVARSMGGVDAAVGRVIQLDAVPLRVVGVVGDVIFTGPVDRRPSDLDIYRPLVQMPRRLISAGVSTRGDPRSLIAPLRARLLQLAPNSPLDWVSPLTVELADRMEGRMFYVVMLGAFAWSALLLTAVGIFAVLAHQVTRRAVEFGVRRALGARETRIVYEVMRRGIVVAVSGMGIGAVGAFLVARVLRTAVTDVAPFDIVTFGGSAVAIIVVTLIASYLPAARAARVAPVEALRAE